MSEEDLRALFTAYRERSGLTTFGALQALIEPSCDLETAAPEFVGSWSPSKRTVGHCDVIAMLVQRLRGGDVLRSALPGVVMHFFNRTDRGAIYDLAQDALPQGVAATKGTEVDVGRMFTSPQGITAHVESRFQLLLSRVVRRLKEPRP